MIWLRICLPTQGTRVGSLVWEDSTCSGATKSSKSQLLNSKTTTTEVHAPQQEKIPKCEAFTPRKRVAPTRKTATRERLHTATKTQHSQK